MALDQAGQPGVCYAALLGIDWGDREHVWSMEEVESGKRSRGKLEQTPEAVEIFMVELMRKYDGRAIAVAVEQKRGALVGMLSKYEALHVYPVHPKTSAQYRAMFHPSGAKDDARDGAELLDLLKKHPERLSRLELDTALTRQLQQLVEQRRRLVDEKTRHSNRLTHQLKLYYPQMLAWFTSLDTEVVAGWLEEWPSLEQVQQARPAQVRKFLTGHGYDAEQIQSRLQAIAQAVPALRDEAIVSPAIFYVQTEVELMRVLRRRIESLSAQIKVMTRQHPDYFIVDSLPGAGEAMAPRLLAALGTQRDRFASAYELQCQSGIAPVTRQSGKTKLVHMRRACPKFVRQTFHEWASHTMIKSAWAREYYEEQRARHKDHHAAVRALAYRWQRIVFRCWKDGIAYDESRYLAARAQHALRLLPKPKTVENHRKTANGL
jgi:transposase